jgi:antitoxin (DNA-binding transcriptional repressor) of toxin-antitoxin stability system
MSMKAVKIAELKNRLSYYLRRVQRGESILVCDRDRVIARIDRVAPHDAADTGDAEWLERLERRGIIRRGTGLPTTDWLAQRPPAGADVVATLLREREEGP